MHGGSRCGTQGVGEYERGYRFDVSSPVCPLAPRGGSDRLTLMDADVGRWTETTLDALSLAVVTLEPLRDQGGAIIDFVYVWANQAACVYNGMSRNEMVGLRLLDVFPGLVTTGTFQQYVEVMETGNGVLLENFIYGNELRGNEPLRYDVRLARGGGGLVVSWQDVTDRFLAVRDLTRNAKTDSLTELTSREEGQAVLERALRGAREAQGLAVAYLDLDGFKRINDTHGHDVGDSLLITTAQRIRAAVRDDDVVIRLGGDEIVVVLHGSESIDTALSVCEKIRKVVAEPFPLADDRLFYTSLSIGLTLATPTDTVRSILQRADVAMYRAKSVGGNRIEIA